METPDIDEAQRRRLAAKLGRPVADFSSDTGARPRAISDAYDTMPSDPGSSIAHLVRALARTRLLLPVMAHPLAGQTFSCATSGEDGFLVEPISANRKALAVFSDVETLIGAYPTARPKPLPIQHICLAALERGGRLLLDATHIVPRPAVAALAQGDSWLASWEDDELQQTIDTLGRSVEGIAHVATACGADATDRLIIGVDASCCDPAKAVNSALKLLMDCQRLVVACDTIVATPVRADKAPA